MSNPSKPARVAVYVPHGATPDVRGYAPSIVAWNFARRMKAVRPFVISAQEHYPEKYEVISGVPVHRIHEGRVYRRLFKKITRLDPYPLHQRAANILKREEWDLLHAHQIEFPINDFRRRVGKQKPIVLHAHVTTHVFNTARGVAQRYITVSKFVSDYVTQNKGYPADRMVVVPNGVDVDCFRPASSPDECRLLRQRYGLPSDVPVIAYFGRKQQVKGFHTWLKVVNVLLQRHGDLHAVAVGPELNEARRDSSYEERQRIRRQLQTVERFKEFPAMPHRELGDFLRMVDLALLPSLSETQGLAVIEAMASGCVTVSSNLGGIPESLQHGETGFLLDRPENVDEAIDVCERLLQSQSAWPAIRSKARAGVVSRFSWDVVTARLEQVYLDVIREGLV